MLFVFIYLFTYLFSVKNGKIVAGKPQPLVTNSPKFPIKIKNSDAQKRGGTSIYWLKLKTEASNSSVEVSIKFESDSQVRLHAKRC